MKRALLVALLGLSLAACGDSLVNVPAPDPLDVAPLLGTWAANPHYLRVSFDRLDHFYVRPATTSRPQGCVQTLRYRIAGISATEIRLVNVGNEVSDWPYEFRSDHLLVQGQTFERVSMNTSKHPVAHVPACE